MSNAMRTDPLARALIDALRKATGYPVGDASVPSVIDGQDPDSFPYLTVYETSTAAWGSLNGDDALDSVWQVDAVGQTASQVRIAADRVVDFMQRMDGPGVWHYPLTLEGAAVTDRVASLSSGVEGDDGLAPKRLFTKSVRYTLRVTPA